MDDSVYERGYPYGAILRLQTLVDEIHPALPISIGRWDDRSSWIYHADPDPDIDAIFAAFDPWSPATGGVFDSGPTPIEEIREAYEDSHTDNEGAGYVGLAEHSGADLGGDGGEHGEAGSDADPGEPADFSAEPVGDDSALGEPGAYPGMMIDHQHTETLLYNLREEPIKLVRDFYESRLTHELGDQDMRNALAFSDDPYRDEKLAWIAAMDAVLEQKLAEIAEMDGMALANYRGEAEGWPAVPVEEVEYEDDEPEGE